MGKAVKKIYFIIPVYNVEEYLSRCVDSVVSQSHKNSEIILIDDGSPDRCPEICDEYGKRYDNITVIHKKNGGLSDARNAGISYVMKKADDDEYITFVDSDDFIHPSYAEKMIGLCERLDCDMAQCGYERGERGRFSENAYAGGVRRTDGESALLGYELKSQVFAKVFKIRTFRNLTFPQGRLNEDEFVTYRAVYGAKGAAFSKEKLYYYFKRGSSIMDDIAKKLKGNPRRYDFLAAYEERALFFEGENKPEQVGKTHEKVCTDIILRYCEQMYLKRGDRDEDCVNGKYTRIYREHFRLMIKRRAIPLRRRMMYIAFFICPYSAVLMGRIFSLRK